LQPDAVGRHDFNLKIEVASYRWARIDAPLQKFVRIVD